MLALWNRWDVVSKRVRETTDVAHLRCEKHETENSGADKVESRTVSIAAETAEQA